MNYIVCIKQVPDTMEVKVDPETKRIVREGVPSILNPYDYYAVEEALRLKERFGGTTIAISMGPPQAEAVLKEAISLGIDQGYLISDRAFAGSDTLATSYTLARAIKKIGDFSVVLCGREAMDGSTGQVGPELAEHLEIPVITYVSKIINIADNRIECVRLLEDHYETLTSFLPVVITVIKEINEPRLPSLKGMLKSKKTQIPVWTKNDIGGDELQFGQDGSPTKVVEIWRPEIKKEGKIVKGEPEELAETIYQELKKLGVA
ncbi:MAG: electron transfer flavoprotein subunit beta/FixA family protein [Candidatus Omnitrophica bacterium]|nr:electron transfer flavoprotein subunit beta/FixA family protein [Candidatus Omnitrophota bacterium]MCM8824798.1 electron transfer flavoprotein subunit beta/FixA family protein [Candidatus Omnitrophota bacterium]